MSLRKKFHWLQLAGTVQGSVIPAVFGQVVFCAVFSLLISILNYEKIPVSYKSLSVVIPSIVLGLLLVFRTNTAYERFWEGRKSWAAIGNDIRNLSRLIWFVTEETEPQHRQDKINTIKQLIAFAVSNKFYLRGEYSKDELSLLLTPERFDLLQKADNQTLKIANWIAEDIQSLYKQGRISINHLVEMQKRLNGMVCEWSACDRIRSTPMPLAYAVHLKQLVLIYCLLLPFQLVSELQWWTAPVVALISFTLFGIEEIGMEIENPFGRDYNDLPLDFFCVTIERNLNELINTEPHYYSQNYSQTLNTKG